MKLAQITLEKMLTGVSVHVAYEMLPVLEGLLANGAFIRAIGAVSALVMCQMRSLTERLIAGVTLVGFLPRVHSFVTREFGKVAKRLIAHGAFIRTIRVLKSRRGRGTHGCSVAGCLRS